MGVNADITIYGWLKPTLTVELVAGGSLSPNTKYYVMGVMGYTPRTYHLNGGPVSDVHEITTTATDLSIKVTHKTYRDITGFTATSDGRTECACSRHCLADTVVGMYADTIKIDSGSYAGTHLVDEWVDYDTFIIDTPYVDNVPVQCYTDSQYYNRPYRGGNANQGMAIYISTTDPYDSKGLLGPYNYQWDRRPWTAPAGGFANPKTYTSQPAFNLNRYSGQPELSRLAVGPYAVLKDYGSIHVDVEGTDYTSFEEIYDEVQASGFIYNCGWTVCGYNVKNKFSLIGSLKLNNAVNGAKLIGGGYDFFITSEFYESGLSRPEAIIFTDCIIHTPGIFSVVQYYTANNCVFFDSSTSNSYTGWITGTDLIIYGAPRASDSYADEYTTYWDELRLETRNLGLVLDKIFRTNGSDLLQQNSYNTVKYIRTTLTPIYWIFSGQNKPDTYMMEDCVIRWAYSYEWCIRFYTYTQYSDNELKMLNVDCPDDPDNHKLIIRNRDYFNLIVRWYRRIEIYVQDDDGVLLSGVQIRIVDGAGNVYTEETDSAGYAFIEVLEQIDVVDDTMAYEDPHTTIYYTDFVVTTSYPDYAAHRLEFAEAYENTRLEIGLVPLQTYVEGLIHGDASEEEITGVSVQEEITGVTEAQVIEVDVEEDIIYADVEEETITGTIE